MAKKTADDADHLRLLRGVFQGTSGQGVVELRAIPADRTKQIRRLWTRLPAQIDDFVAEFGRRDSGYSVYFGACKRKEEGGAKKSDVLCATALWADIDTVNHGWDTDATLQAVYKLKGALQPSCIVASGGGLHLWWFLSEPLTDMQQIEDANKALAEIVSGDAVHDVTRIMRLPGTFNPKRQARAELVYCYPFERRDVHELMDAALSHKTVLVADKWVKRADAEKAMASAGTTDEAAGEAYTAARSLTGGRALEKNLDALWSTQVRHKPTRGYIGIDEAVMVTTARLWCKYGSRQKDVSAGMDAVVDLTWRYLREATVRWEQGEWDAAKQKDAIRRKLARWVQKWRVIQAAADAEQKRRKALGGKQG